MTSIIVISIIIGLLIYSLISFYIGYNGWAWLKSTFLAKYKKTYICVMILLSLSLFAGRLLPFAFLEWISGYWMAVFGYSLMILPLANIIYFILKKNHKFWIGIGVIVLYSFIFIYGTYNAWTPVVRTYEIEIDKKTNLKDLKIFMASDIHLSGVVGTKHLERLVKLVDAEDPDIVLLPGDIINDNIEQYQKQNMSDVFKKIDAPLGVYAVLGNHDYYGNDDQKILAEMEKIGVGVLMDEFINIGDYFYLAGRKEHTDNSRKELSKYFKGLDKSKPIIMMDHQPKDLTEAKENGVDLLVSGHTHRGQIAPANFITDRIYENDWGHMQKGSFHSIVSSGFGLWGPPLRIGTQAEVMVINVKFVGK
ncbi:metallophosphoesterase [Neobacillus sp. LXY-4]|uniref:metallophosphoesterase n=1 Tax=Neobacillus sp. LXY-4 TaxID=3379826 RepID=UPI003EE06067